MLSQEEKKQLLVKKAALSEQRGQALKVVRELAIAVRRLGEQLNQLDSKKKWQIEKAKELKSIRDALAARIKELKQKRSEESQKVLEIISQLKAKTEELRALEIRLNIKSFSRFRKEVENFEFKLQTRVFPPEQEKKYQERLRKMKEELKKAKEGEEFLKQCSALKRELENRKRSREKIHKEIIALALENQNAHKSLLEISKSIDETQASALKLKEELFKKRSSLKEKKKELSEIEKQFNEVLKKLGLEEKAREERERIKAERNAWRAYLEAKSKLAKGKTLTTEDILVLQRFENERVGDS